MAPFFCAAAVLAGDLDEPKIAAALLLPISAFVRATFATCIPLKYSEGERFICAVN